MDYKETLHMPATDFEMRGNLPTKEPKILKQLRRECQIRCIHEKRAAQESQTVLPLMMKDFAEHHVQQLTNTKVSSISNNVVKAVNTKDETEIEISADTVVAALGSRNNVVDVTGITKPVHYVGDCSGERTADIANAIRTAYHTANKI